MVFDKNILRFLQFRDEILVIDEIEKKYQIKLPPIYRSFITVFKPYFAHVKYKKSNNNGFGSFIVPMYSSVEKENYTSDDDELGFEAFKEVEELLSFEPSKADYLKDYLFIADHGYWGGLLVGISEHNADKIYHCTDDTTIRYVANNIFELLHRIKLVKYDFESPSIDENRLYRRWSEDFWRIDI